MAATVARAASWTTSIDKAGWRALAASWLGWMFDGYETYAIVLVMGQAVASFSHRKGCQLSQCTWVVCSRPRCWDGQWAVSQRVWLTRLLLAAKRMLMISILWYAVFAGLTALSQTTGPCSSFGFLRDSGWVPNSGPGTAIVAEFWPPSLRGRAGGALHAALGVGFFLASGIWLLVNPLGSSS